MSVTVHSLGAIDAPMSDVVVRGRDGKMLASAKTPVLKAPTDLLPKTATVTMMLPAGAEMKGGSVSIEMGGAVPEITMMNNRVQF